MQKEVNETNLLLAVGNDEQDEPSEEDVSRGNGDGFTANATKQKERPKQAWSESAMRPWIERLQQQIQVRLRETYEGG